MLVNFQGIHLVRTIVLVWGLACTHVKRPFMVPIEEPTHAKGAWAAMRACSQAIVVDGGDLKDVHWFVGDLTALDIIRNSVEYALAELLSNPRLPGAIAALSTEKP